MSGVAFLVNISNQTTTTRSSCSSVHIKFNMVYIFPVILQKVVNVRPTTEK